MLFLFKKHCSVQPFYFFPSLHEASHFIPFELRYGLVTVSFLCISYFQEIYSIKLPGNPKLGEGKPENQNHAIIFTRGEAVQTIDMNQVCYMSYLGGYLSWFLIEFSIVLSF